MSLSSRERRNPPPRQKSCAACIRAKRRCEPSGGFTPACTRCEQRGLSCELPQRRAKRHAEAANIETPSFSVMDTYADFISPPMDAGTCVQTPLPTPGFPSFLPLEPFPQWDQNVDTMTLNTDAAPPQTGFSLAEFGEDTPLPLIHQPAMPVGATGRNEWVPLPEFARRRLQYPIDQIKKVPRMFVSEGQTPWCHPRLWEDETPQSIQDALSSCALSIHLNPLNTPLILQTLTTRTKSLLARPTPTTPTALLAHTQSLLLHHIILIFTSDIHVRSLADNTQSALEDSAMSLLTHINFDVVAQHPSCELQLYPIAPTLHFWKDWIFQESGRRTLLFTFFLLQAYRILAGKPIDACDGKLGMCHSFTLSARLWHADSAVEFAKAWEGSRHLVVTDAKLELAFREARAHDVDAFGRILITSIMGVDEAEGWFASHGGSLFTKEDGFV